MRRPILLLAVVALAGPLGSPAAFGRSTTAAGVQLASQDVVAGRPAGADQAPGQAGEGELAVTLSAPGTSWADPVDTAVVVEARVDSGPAQTFVLHAGAAPHTYRGFTGPMTTGPHTVTVQVRADLSSVRMFVPAFELHAAALTVLTAADAGYEQLATAPILYGRAVNNRSDVPLLTYAVPIAGGHEYTTIWSNEDSGSGVVPAYLWGSYGRMTDIESTIAVTAGPGGTRAGRIQTCGACPSDWPEDVTGLDHSYRAFAGQWWFGHPVLRVFTGNNLVTDDGRTTPYRFQQALSAPPRSGATREDAMDQAAWTYRTMGAEVRREHPEGNEIPQSFLAGDARQYAIIELDVAQAGASSIAVELRLAGEATWWASDYAMAPGVQGSSFPFYTGGLSRTVVKLPSTWHGSAIGGVRLRLNARPGAPAPTATVKRFRVLELTPDYEIVARPLPPGPIPFTTGVSVT